MARNRINGKTPMRASEGRRNGVASQGAKTKASKRNLPLKATLDNGFIAMDIRRRGKVCLYNLEGSLAALLQSIRFGGVHTLLLRQQEEFWEGIKSLQELGLRIRIKPLWLGGKRYYHVWLMEHVHSAVEVRHG
ncbi:MAG: hypothetical protein EBQ80_01965 [Proteobacteria bacterium]|nr:hypothetical protein [Pseudomonadota bacterium]